MDMVDSRAPTVVLDLPHNVLDAIFGLCGQKATIGSNSQGLSKVEADF